MYQFHVAIITRNVSITHSAKAWRTQEAKDMCVFEDRLYREICSLRVYLRIDCTVIRICSLHVYLRIDCTVIYAPCVCI